MDFFHSKCHKLGKESGGKTGRDHMCAALGKKLADWQKEANETITMMSPRDDNF